jgi:hypothetical protein
MDRSNQRSFIIALTGITGTAVFTGEDRFTVKEIEVFTITL